MKIAIIYKSKSGNTEKIADLIKEGLTEVDNVEVKSMKVEEVDYEFLKEAKAVVFGTPTYYASFSWEIKKWFDESKGCDLEGKLGAVFATENHIGGGADVALLSLIGNMLVKGMIIYSGGSALGQPYVHMGAVAIKDGDEAQKDRAKIFGKRIANKAMELFG